ncbi:TolC family protein [Neolewinella persica]|uniref:TolC family protein n=1 Tax=Neolewinella persica TaxID=70998 RepID=UPI00146A274B|nr:TolC family protein [Neolewinella persica]
MKNTFSPQFSHSSQRALPNERKRAQTSPLSGGEEPGEGHTGVASTSVAHPGFRPLRSLYLGGLKRADLVRELRLPLLLLTLLCTCGPAQTYAQKVYELTLNEVVDIARSESPDMKLAETRLNNTLWRYRSFQADFKPQIQLNATLPGLNRSIDNIILPDGREDFISRALMRNTLSISLSQPIVATGGQVFLTTSLRRLDVFKTDLNPYSLSYLSTPISLGFIQPLRGYNDLRWRQKIEPLRYLENKRFFNESKEQAAAIASDLFFDLLIAQLNLEAATKNKANSDTLYQISQGRYGVGRIAETDLLQIELSVMNANAALASANLNAQTANEELRSFLGITENADFQLRPPSSIPTNQVDPEEALGYAMENRSLILGFERRALEAAADLDQAKKDNGFQVNIQGQFGLSGTGNSFGSAYDGLIDQEVVTLGIQVPIADFGKARSRIEVARSNQELELLNIAQERISFERRIRLQVGQFDLLRNQVALGDRAYEVALRREEITRKRYLIGKLSIIELNLAVREMDEARRQYMSSLRDFWIGYYELRRLTLFDFVTGEKLFVE